MSMTLLLGICLLRECSYAGWLGTVAGRYKENDKLSDIPSIDESRHRLAACAGTSTCHIVQVQYKTLTLCPTILTLEQSKEGVFVKGVWGPYKVRHPTRDTLDTAHASRRARSCPGGG